MKADIYARQSISNSEGIERQVERCTKLLQNRGWEVGTVFRDNAQSATKARSAKSDWARMLQSPAEVVVAVDLDRLLRTQRDLLVLIDSGKKVVTVDGEIDLSTADGEFRASMLAGIARFEVRRKSERQLRANEHRAREGKWVGGRRPFGFEEDGMTSRPDEAEAIRWGYKSLLAGMSLGEIATEWNARGLTTGQGSPWERTAVRHVFLNPRHMGVVRYKGEIIGPAEWPATVDEATFRAADTLLRSPGRRAAHTHNGKHLLTGVAVCGVCGARAHSGGNARKGVPGYRCSEAFGHFARMAKPVEDYVEAVVVARLARPDAVDLLRKDRPDTAAMHEHAVVLRGRLDALAVDYADGILTRSQLQAATERLKSELARVEAGLAEAGRVDALSELVGVEDVAAAWNALSTERKRTVINALMSVRLMPVGRGTRTFRPETVDIEWKH